MRWQWPWSQMVFTLVQGHCSVWPWHLMLWLRALWILMSKYQTWYPDSFNTTLLSWNIQGQVHFKVKGDILPYLSSDMFAPEDFTLFLWERDIVFNTLAQPDVFKRLTVKLCTINLLWSSGGKLILQFLELMNFDKKLPVTYIVLSDWMSG